MAVAVNLPRSDINETGSHLVICKLHTPQRLRIDYQRLGTIST